MSDHNVPVTATSFRTEPGHLAVTVEGLRAPEMPFLFERKPERMGGSAWKFRWRARGAQLIALLLTLYGTATPDCHPGHAGSPTKDIVWLSVPGLRRRWAVAATR